MNHRRTSKMKMASTQPSAKLILPNFLYSSLITWYASLSPSFFVPHPKDFLKLQPQDAKIKKILFWQRRCFGTIKWLKTEDLRTYLRPKNMNCSHNHDKASMRIMLGNEKPNQLAKLITPLFSGKSLLSEDKKITAKLAAHRCLLICSLETYMMAICMCFCCLGDHLSTNGVAESTETLTHCWMNFTLKE